MAEVVIPMLGLGAMYILSNEDKKNKIASQNINNNNQIYNINQGQFSNKNNSKQISNYNQHTDKFFHENNYLNSQNQKTSFGVGNNDIK